MFTAFDLIVFLQLVVRVFVSLSFAIGVILVISPEAFDMLSKALSKEYGLKTRFIPKVELKIIHLLDKIIARHRIYGILAGAVIAILSLILLAVNHR